jgi:cellulose synthase/poly-beta-1,6-N-acetylglucosamine synthase-like glycosyltransferase
MASFSGDAVPTWHLGATANAAFRSSIFTDREIGLLEEVLGPGTPTGVGEDTELFYRVLRAGHSVVYQPDAYVWHDHRNTMKALKQQIYAYSKGHIAYNHFVAFRYRDGRSLRRVFVVLPLWRLRQSYRWLRDVLRGRKPRWPLSLVLTETAGNLAGPWSLLRSIWRVRRLGRIERPYANETPVTETLTQQGRHEVIQD